jgi:probable HAF family extracellular repeat protein
MNRRVFALLLAALLVIVPTVYSLRAAGPVYTVEDLGALDGLVPTITGMNVAGQLSGHVSGPSGSRAVWFNNGAWNYLPGLSNTFSLATGINAQGDITGYRLVVVVVNNKNTNVLRAFRYVHGSAAVEAIDPPTGGTTGTAFGIADNGTVVGSGTIPGVGPRAWIATGTAAQLVTGLDGMTSKACGINASGQVVGSYTSPTAGTEHAFRLDADGMVNDLGTLDGGAGTSMACAIDSDGTVGGKSLSGNQTLAFLSAGGTPINVTPAGSSVAEVKGVANGVAVGSFTVPATGEKHAFVHTDADGTTDLNDRLAAGSGWVLSDAVVVNANGVIAGLGTLIGSPRAFRLTPGTVSDTTAPTITSLTASPSSITPPNKAMVSVTVSAAATDDQDPNPSCAVTSVDGHGAPADDALFSGLSATVRATGGAVYTLMVTCSDAAGNHALGKVDVAVPLDTTVPVVTSLSVSPDTIPLPRGQFVTVTTTAVATDDSGDTPVCTLSGITAPGATSADYSVTGGNTGTVKAVGGRVYTVTETCTDGSGNAASASVDVTVLADTKAPVIAAVVPSPATIAPPNNLLVPVTLAVTATDDVDDQPACVVSSVSASGAAAGDYSITDALSAKLRAVGGRTYHLDVVCTDAAGNHDARTADVVVPPDTTAPVFTSLTASPDTIWPPKGQFVTVTTAAVATDDSGETPVCTLSGITAPGATAADYSVTGTNTGRVKAVGGRVYTVTETCTDGSGNARTASANVTVLADTKPPVIAAIVPSPSTIGVPNNLLVPVTLAVTATDDVDDQPICALSSISASSAAAGDYSITGAFSAKLRAVGGRVYRLNVVCTDAAGNSAAGFTQVVVPPDSEAPVVTSMTASPGYVWPPNGKMINVALAVQVADNVDTTPQCTLTSVSSNGGAAGDVSLTGPLSANVRAEKNADGSVRVYTFNVTCVDDAGNSSTWTTGVAVNKDASIATATLRFKLIRTALAHMDWHATLQRLAGELRAARR